LSGLECNVDKTTLLQVGDVGVISQEIVELGFAVINEVTVLGLTVSGPGADFSGSLNKICDKLQSQVVHWSRFNLSLPGRITIAKTMLYSQINYLGCFLPINSRIMGEYELIIEHFVKGRLSIAKTRIYKPICMGGLGLFKIEDFLNARVAWIRRAQTIDDRWKIMLYYNSYGSVFNLRSQEFSHLEGPCLSAIVSSYEKFLKEFTKTKENFWDAYIYNNSALTLALRGNRTLDNRSFPANLWLGNEMKIKGLRIRDFINRNNIGFY
jgi:hypothetical protein